MSTLKEAVEALVSGRRAAQLSNGRLMAEREAHKEEAERKATEGRINKELVCQTALEYLGVPRAFQELNKHFLRRQGQIFSGHSSPSCGYEVEHRTEPYYSWITVHSHHPLAWAGLSFVSPDKKAPFGKTRLRNELVVLVTDLHDRWGLSLFALSYRDHHHLGYTKDWGKSPFGGLCPEDFVFGEPLNLLPIGRHQNIATFSVARTDEVSSLKERLEPILAETFTNLLSPQQRQL